MIMAVLIFIGENLVLCGSISTGPHLDLDFPFSWLHLHRYGRAWAIEHFDFTGLVIAVLASILLTWLFSKALRNIRRRP